MLLWIHQRSQTCLSSHTTNAFGHRAILIWMIQPWIRGYYVNVKPGSTESMPLQRPPSKRLHRTMSLKMKEELATMPEKTFSESFAVYTSIPPSIALTWTWWKLILEFSSLCRYYGNRLSPVSVCLSDVLIYFTLLMFLKLKRRALYVRIRRTIPPASHQPYLLIFLTLTRTAVGAS